MPKIKNLIIAIAALCLCSCTSAKKHSQLQSKLNSYLKHKDARIGIAVISGKDTVQVNGRRDFPMLSVYKFPQAIAVAEYCTSHGLDIDGMVSISANQMEPDTWSPMRDKYGITDLRLSLRELLTYSLAQSDNNACDILFNLIGGTAVADSILKTMGIIDIEIASTESDMHRDIYQCYLNRSTPLAMAKLINNFYGHGLNHKNPIMEEIGKIMIECETGKNRLPYPLSPGTKIGHKTGTGDRNSQNRIIGINDAGYIFLSANRGYTIAVFIADSAYSTEETEKMIAEISDIVYRAL